MKIAYADPPYPGMAKRYGRREVNHERLIAALDRFDGWALSTSVPGLRRIWQWVPDGVTVCAWTKTFCIFKKNVWPSRAWEPVLVKPARKLPLGSKLNGSLVLDWHRSAPNMNGFFGSKPPEFCGWLFSILGAEPDDEFHDLFKGSGAVTRAWKQWSGAPPLFQQPQTSQEPEAGA